MKKNDFLKIVTDKVRTTEEFAVTQRETDAYIAAIKETIMEAMADGDEVAIPGFLKFTVGELAARVARNPQTGALINVPAKKKVKVKVLSDLKNSVL